MSIEKLKAELQKMQSFDEKAAEYEYSKFTPNHPAWSEKTGFIEGARFEHAKHARTAQMLLEAIEALELIRTANCPKHIEHPQSVWWQSHVVPIARETLAKLAKGDESE